MISTDRVAALPVNSNVSSLIICITDNTLDATGLPEPPGDLLTTQSIVLNLAYEIIETNMILEGVTGQWLPVTGVLALSICQTPLDKASGTK